MRVLMYWFEYRNIGVITKMLFEPAFRPVPFLELRLTQFFRFLMVLILLG